uniref:Hypoxanthine phosphoribosyltransferase n=5 Tax=Parascaris univalens TaxID=6257 RepID=A0A915ABI7_PARUN
MIIDGYSVLFLFTAGLLLITILVILIQRQIFRLRNNNVRREQNIAIGAGMTKSQKNEVLRRIELVRQFQLLRAPKFTEIGTIAEHASAPYINRMIALDELREIDRQLEFINADLVRIAGESTYAYLSRIRRIALPTLSEALIERLGFLAEHCRFRHQPFGEVELAEVRALIKDVVRILNSEQERLSALQLKPSDSGSGVGPALSASLHSISKRLSTGENKLQMRKRSARNAPTNAGRKSRASAGRNSVDRQKRARPRQGCEEYELPLLHSYDSSARPQEVSSRPTTSVSRAAASDALRGVSTEHSSLISS